MKAKYFVILFFDFQLAYFAEFRVNLTALGVFLVRLDFYIISLILFQLLEGKRCFCKLFCLGGFLFEFLVCRVSNFVTGCARHLLICDGKLFGFLVL